jgi:hypothetical protein
MAGPISSAAAVASLLLGLQKQEPAGAVPNRPGLGGARRGGGVQG